MGLGGYPAVSLAAARKRAAEVRTAVSEERDPIAERQRQTEPTFGEAAAQLVDALEPNWKHWRSAWEWRSLFRRHCSKIAGRKVSNIDTEAVLGVLKPLWSASPDMAQRLRSNIERVPSFSKARGWREGENSAAWRGHLDHILPRRPKTARRHHAALPYGEVGDFLVRLRSLEALTARVVEFVILTAVRSGEARGARWCEIDFAKALWTIPGSRMKAGKEHVVPLSSSALALLEQLREVRINDLIFPGVRSGKPLSESAIDQMLRRMQLNGQLTVHGFRSSFRDWAGNETAFPREVAEEALAHAVGNQVERSYRRSQAVEKQRQLMQAWADYLEGVEAKVVPLKRA